MTDVKPPLAGVEEQRREPSVTIAHIAEWAGVSVPTVSKVLNGRPGVSDVTRARVEELIENSGYRKAPAAPSNILELVFRELTGIRAVDVIRGVEQVARAHKVAVVISESAPDGSAASTAALLDGIVERRPRCVLAVAELSETERERLTSKDIPFVVLDPESELPDDVPFVGAMNWRGGQTATRHLVELGHRRIAAIGGRNQLSCRARLAGFHSAMESAGIRVDQDSVIGAALTQEGGYEAARTLLSRPERPTAIFAVSDLQAFGVYRAAREAGLNIPDDLSVVGFDDIPVTAWVEPPLTTVRQPLAEMAAAAAEMAFALSRGDKPVQTGVEMATALTLRGSTAPPPSTA